MNKNDLIALLEAVKIGQSSIESSAEIICRSLTEDIDFAHIDHHRPLRKGFPEVIFGEGKSAEQIVSIMDRISRMEGVVIATRVDPEKGNTVCGKLHEAVYHADARMVVWQRTPLPKQGRGRILVISAGTSDIPVAKEAMLTADVMGNEVDTIFDVGVAGIHRLFGYIDVLRNASVLVVVAGMEGALPSVVAGLVEKPVIAVPTSVGYGASLNGLTALFGMLNSCSSNVSVVNIDNGFGAGYVASCINQN